MFCCSFKRVLVALLLALGCFSGSRLAAATNGFVVPSFRGAGGSQMGYWEVFTVASGDPGNAPDSSSATTQARLFQINTNAFLTGSGNIYNQDVSQFQLVDETPFALGTVILQTRTAGTEVARDSMVLVYLDDGAEVRLAPQSRYELNRTSGQGFNVSMLWQWNLTGRNVKEYRVEFAAAGSSLSFDSLTLDTSAHFAKAFPEQPLAVGPEPANLARWMYPFNGSPGDRPTASVFGALGSNPDFDSRDAQYLLGWNTTSWLPAGRGASNYLVRRVRLTLTISNDRQYPYSGTVRDFRTYFPTNDPGYLPSPTTGFPVELFGAGFRGGYSSTTYPQTGPWGVNPAAGFFSNRVAYAAGFDTNGVLVDVSNSVADNGTNAIPGAFEVAPFAVGVSTNVAHGELMPVGSQLTFDVNLEDPLIYGYFQEGLNAGNLSFMVSSLIDATLNGPPTYPNFYTIFSAVALPSQYPNLELDVQLVRPEFDSDADGLPDDWENHWFGTLLHSGSEDSDADGVSNLEEWSAGTAPDDANSLLRILKFQLDNEAVAVESTVAPGRGTTLESATTLGDWQSVSGAQATYLSDWLTKTGDHPSHRSPIYQVWKAGGTNAPQHFYRVITR